MKLETVIKHCRIGALITRTPLRGCTAISGVPERGAVSKMRHHPRWETWLHGGLVPPFFACGLCGVDNR